MSTQENKAIVRRLADECWNKKNLTVLDDVIGPDCPHHMNGPVNFQGPEGYRAALERWFEAFPDIQATIEDEVAHKVATRGKLTGTHQGELKFDPMPSAIHPTGKRLEMDFASLYRITNGKIVEIWDTADLSWIQQFSQG
jgi:predicted ester cyclase